MPHGLALFASIVFADALVTALALMFLTVAKTRDVPRWQTPPSHTKITRRAYDWKRDEVA